MIETYLRQSPLAHMGLHARAVAEPADAGVILREHSFETMFDVKGDAEAMGLALPMDPNTVVESDTHRALWLGPGHWLVVAPKGTAEALAGPHAALTDVSEARAVIGLEGANAQDVLMKGCPLDLHPRSFGAGRCAGTVLASAAVILHQRSDAPAYDVYVQRSLAEYLWTWLEDAAAEYGLAISAG